MNTIKFNTQTITINGENSKLLSEVIVERIIDNINAKEIIVFIEGIGRRKLFFGNEGINKYPDNGIFDKNFVDISNRIKEVLNISTN